MALVSTLLLLPYAGPASRSSVARSCESAGGNLPPAGVTGGELRGVRLLGERGVWAPDGLAQAVQSGPLVASRSEVVVPATAVGAVSAPVPLQLVNPTNGIVQFSSLGITGEFSETDDCLPQVQPGARCLINITFAPLSAGALTGLLNVVFQDGSVLSVGLSGAGVPAAPEIQLPGQLAFPDTEVGASSVAPVAITNNTGIAIAVARVATTGDFLSGGSCPGGVIPANGVCTLIVRFSPSSAGALVGSLSIDSTNGTLATLPLTGTGVAGRLVVDPATVAFPRTVVGVPSQPEAVRVTNSGTSSLQLSGIAADGDFAERSDCPTSLLPGASCTVNVVAVPSVPGLRDGVLLVQASGEIAAASLSISGVAASGGKGPGSSSVTKLAVGAGLGLTLPILAPSLRLGGGGGTHPDFRASRYALDLPAGPAEAVGRSVTVSNLTGDALEIDAVGVGPLAVFGCGRRVAKGSSCDLEVRPQAGAEFAERGVLIVSDDKGFVSAIGVRIGALGAGGPTRELCSDFAVGKCQSLAMRQCGAGATSGIPRYLSACR